jgi:hypothetical protein
MKSSRIAISIYYLTIGIFVLCLGAITLKMTFWPVCSQNSSTTTCVDGWSIAGLAATLLGMGVTLFGVLGALAIAAWWSNLDKRVDTQVNRLFEHKEKALDTKVDSLLHEQENKVALHVTRFQESYDSLCSQVLALNNAILSLENTIRSNQEIANLALDAAISHTPGSIGDWAKEKINKSNVLAIYGGPKSLDSFRAKIRQNTTIREYPFYLLV